MEKIIHLLIINWIKGVDTYTHNGSTWLIFTDSKKWVIELTDSKTLWYNYNFFKQIFDFTSLDVVDNQHYITKWVEDNIINKVKDTILERNITEGEVEEIIENGVKETSSNVMMFQSMKVKDTIQNGVKHTITSENRSRLTAENIIENGVRHTLNTEYMPTSMVEDIIQSGVKLTQFNDNENKSWVEGVIKNGVKETKEMDEWVNTPRIVGDVIENGVKKTSLKRGTRPFMVKDTIKNGVKETKTPGKDGDIMSTVEWMNENKSNSYSKMINDVLDNGVKETKHANRYESIGTVFKESKIENVIENGDKVSGTFVGGKRQKENIESVIGYGTKNPTD